jgi:ATP-binding cassette subfamily B (MDR/TAP) protein 1
MTLHTEKGKEKNDGKKEKEPLVPFFSMFRYATPFDKMLMLIGSLAAIANGASILFSLFFFLLAFLPSLL